MAEYGKLLSRIWSDPDFTALTARAQQVYCMLISYPTRNYAGVLPLTLRRWAKSTSDATVTAVVDALRELSRARFVVIDTETEELLIRSYIRNDEVFRQPNLMRSAAKSARQTESSVIRWAIHDELARIPVDEMSQGTLITTKSLVDELSQTPREPFAEPFAEPFDEGSGVGVTYVSNDCTFTYTEHQAPNTPTAGIDEPRDEPAVPHPRQPRNGSALARTNFANTPRRTQAAIDIANRFAASRESPPTDADLIAIGVEITKALDSGIPPPTIITGLIEWDQSDSWATSQIGRFITKAGRRKTTDSAIDTNVATWLDMQTTDTAPEITA